MKAFLFYIFVMSSAGTPELYTGVSASSREGCNGIIQQFMITRNRDRLPLRDGRWFKCMNADDLKKYQ